MVVIWGYGKKLDAAIFLFMVGRRVGVLRAIFASFLSPRLEDLVVIRLSGTRGNGFHLPCCYSHPLKGLSLVREFCSCASLTSLCFKRWWYCQNRVHRSDRSPFCYELWVLRLISERKGFGEPCEIFFVTRNSIFWDFETREENNVLNISLYFYE